MSFGLGIREALGGAAQGASIGSAIPGLGTAAGGAIGGGLGLLSGLFGGGSSIEDQKELMEKAWEYELYRDWETDRKSTRLNSSHSAKSRMPSSA